MLVIESRMGESRWLKADKALAGDNETAFRVRVSVLNRLFAVRQGLSARVFHCSLYTVLCTLIT
jgi:hypothetical protein